MNCELKEYEYAFLMVLMFLQWSVFFMIGTAFGGWWERNYGGKQ